MAEIVGLNGEAILENGAPESIIKVVKEVLVQAERGEIVGVAIITVGRNHAIRTHVQNASGAWHHLVAGTVYLQQDLTRKPADGQS